MAISLAYGVAFGTFFLLMFFPALIMILNDVRRSIREHWHGRKFTPEEVEIAWIHEHETIDEVPVQSIEKT
jgi:hypothetical protein